MLPRTAELADTVGDTGSEAEGQGTSTELKTGGPRQHRFGLQDAVGAVLVLVAFIVGSRLITDNSFLTHLATGRYIVENGGVPSSDIYSWTAPGEPWTVQSWLPSVVYHSINSTLGGWAIRLVNGLLTATLVLHLWKLTERAGQLVTRVVLVGSCLTIGAYLWTPRPLLFGLLALVLVVRVTQGWRSPVVLLPIVYVWVNSHGSFPLAGVYILLVIAGQWIDTRELDKRLIRVAVFAAAGGVLAMVNPVGWRILWFPVHLLGKREALESVAEWASPTFRSPHEWVFLILIGVLLVSIRKSAPWSALLPACLFAMTALLASRNLAAASLILAISLAPYVSGMFGSMDGRQPSRVGTLAVGACVVGFGLSTLALVSSPPVALDKYPTEEVEWMEQRSLIAEENTTIAQRDYVGNYLTFKYGTESRVFVDDRFDFYPQSVLDDHRSLVFGGDFSEIVERRAFNVVLWERDTPFAYWLRDSSEWKIGYASEDWIVACHVASGTAAQCE